MAGASTKRIQASNKATITKIRYGFIISTTIYILSLFFFHSNRNFSRSFYFISTESIGLLLWRQLEISMKRGEDLNAGGLTA